MSSLRKGRIEILGEDERGQLQQFVWQVLKKLGFNAREFNKTPAPAGKGMGKSFVLKTLPELLDLHRQQFRTKKSVRLIVCLDADEESLPCARTRVEDATRHADMPSIESHEGVVVLIAKRNIETWLESLEGQDANEQDEYKHRAGKEGAISQAVARFVEFVQNPQSMPQNVLPSIREAVEELQRELLPDLSRS